MSTSPPSPIESLVPPAEFDQIYPSPPYHPQSGIAFSSVSGCSDRLAYESDVREYIQGSNRSHHSSEPTRLQEFPGTQLDRMSERSEPILMPPPTYSPQTEICMESNQNVNYNAGTAHDLRRASMSGSIQSKGSPRSPRMSHHSTTTPHIQGFSTPSHPHVQNFLDYSARSPGLSPYVAQSGSNELQTTKMVPPLLVYPSQSMLPPKYHIIITLTTAADFPLMKTKMLVKKPGVLVTLHTPSHPPRPVRDDGSLMFVSNLPPGSIAGRSQPYQLYRSADDRTMETDMNETLTLECHDLPAYLHVVIWTTFAMKHDMKRKAMSRDGAYLAQGKIEFDKIKANREVGVILYNCDGRIERMGVCGAKVNLKCVPSQVMNLQATEISNDRVKLEWSSPSHDGNSSILGYKIWFCKEPMSPNTAEPYAIAGNPLPDSPDACEFSVLCEDTRTQQPDYLTEPLQGGSSYLFRVAAINRVGVGVESNNIRVLTLATRPAAPSAPEVVRVNKRNDGVELEWSAADTSPGMPISGYQLYMKKTKESFATKITPLKTKGSWKDLGTVTLGTDDGLSSGILGTTVSNLEQGYNYVFKVAAVNEAGIGKESRPGKPVTLSVI